MRNGMYVIRTKELPWARKLTGVICLVESVSDDGALLLRVTEDCVPRGGALKVAPQGDDGCWYDVSDLVMVANSAIAPSSTACEFSSLVESSYRNYIDVGNVYPLSLDDACNTVCLIGEQLEDGRTVFGKTGFYIIDFDANNYVIAYRGFCEHTCGVERKLSLCILNLCGTTRQFYPADAIVSQCHAAFMEDTQLAGTYRERITNAVSGASTDYGNSVVSSSDAIRHLVLGAN